MKSLFVLFTTFITLGATGQVINFPDANLKNALVNHKKVIDSNGDGEIQQQEAMAFTQALSITGKSIVRLSGLEYFINADTLYAGFNVITSANFDKMPWLRHLDISSNNSLLSINLKGLIKFK